MTNLVLVLASLAPTTTLDDVINDPRSYAYSDSTAPQVIQDDNGLIYLRNHQFATASRYDRAAVNPNLMRPWLTAGGLDRVRHTGVKLLWIPVDEWVRLRTRKATFRRSNKTVVRTFGKYPDGAISVEFLDDHTGRLFEIRSRIRLDAKWDEHERVFYGARPVGYQEITDCRQCHRDVAGHRQGWATTVRGLEPGGPFSFHPFETDTLDSRPGQAPVIRDDVKHFVIWEPN
jgi:hypothetical protein